MLPINTTIPPIDIDALPMEIDDLPISIAALRIDIVALPFMTDFFRMITALLLLMSTGPLLIFNALLFNAVAVLLEIEPLLLKIA